MVAYIDGSWDCFCAAHVDLLQNAKDAARELFPDDVAVKLVVGIDDDKVCSLLDHTDLPFTVTRRVRKSGSENRPSFFSTKEHLMLRNAA